MDDLKGRVAAVSGAASGIGLALAARLDDEGMKVALAARPEDIRLRRKPTILPPR